MVGEKYEPLRSHLQRQQGSAVTLSFVEIEAILEAPLPPSARKHQAWWSANVAHRSQDHAWIDAGWTVDKADQERGLVTFRRL
ncbi:hypothetical protein PRN20_17875 [Devosia sp. ZB163]|uniref:DUF7662 domain-containing protein n=1 Tax=Devosia sp. ZB163 TaxID=3025938 RepID=UPI002361F31C|nr:hypothetical protein [Devosia sp. ZB163]MDC9825606.1 hypothetical protein [Devosia sp. ZB163]